MKSSDIATAESSTAQLSFSKEEHSNTNSRNFSLCFRRIKTSKAGGANGCEYSVKLSSQAPQSMMLHGSVVSTCEHVKDEANGGDHQEVMSSQMVDGGRETLKRHRDEVAGRVLIPDKWGQEELLKDWIDCSAFEALLVPKKIALARKALAADGRRASTNTTSHQQLRIESRC